MKREEVFIKLRKLEKCATLLRVYMVGVKQGYTRI